MPVSLQTAFKVVRVTMAVPRWQRLAMACLQAHERRVNCWLRWRCLAVKYSQAYCQRVKRGLRLRRRLFGYYNCKWRSFAWSLLERQRSRARARRRARIKLHHIAFSLCSKHWREALTREFGFRSEIPTLLRHRSSHRGVSFGNGVYTPHRRIEANILSANSLAL